MRIKCKERFPNTVPFSTLRLGECFRFDEDTPIQMRIGRLDATNYCVNINNGCFAEVASEKSVIRVDGLYVEE